jgi:FAD:protein FMN transferase
MQRPELAERHRFPAIGTRWRIDTAEPLGQALRERIRDRVEEYDRVWSRFREDSLVRRAASEPGRHLFPDEAVALMDLYWTLYERTQGAMTPLIGVSLERLGYDAGYRLRPDGDPLPAPAWEPGLRWEGSTLVAEHPALLDVGAAGKGQLVDILGGLLEEAGHEHYCVDGSGDLRHRGGRPLRVALEDPRAQGRAIGVAELDGRSICASAGDRRAWGDGLHHILDARTGNPAREVVATWVIAADTALADGLATALFFTGAHQLANTFHFGYVRMYADGRAERSRDFPGELFT